MALVSDEHNRAEHRLSAARIEQHRLNDCYEAAVGTSGEMAAGVELSAATAQVAARDAWLDCVDTEESHIAVGAVQAPVDPPLTALEAWLRWADDEGRAGRNAGDVARLRHGSQRRHRATGCAAREEQLEQRDGIAHTFLKTSKGAVPVVSHDEQTLAAEHRDNNVQESPATAL